MLVRRRIAGDTRCFVAGGSDADNIAVRCKRCMLFENINFRCKRHVDNVNIALNRICQTEYKIGTSHKVSGFIGFAFDHD